jgi:hypothetical protein
VAHLEGKEVAVLVNGIAQTNKTVTGGLITLDTAMTTGQVAQVGLPYTPRLKSIDLETATRQGTSQGKIKHITSVGVRVHESGSFKYGSAWDKMDTYTPTPGKVMTKDIYKPFPSGDKEKAYVYIEGVGPTPLTIIALMPKVEVNER